MRIARNAGAQILIAVALALALGFAAPDLAASMKPLGEGFFKLVRMMVAPIIFTTVASSLAGIGNLRQLGRIGLKTLLYFEVVSTVALLLGIVLVNLAQPGAGLHATALGMTDAVTRLADPALDPSVTAMLMRIIPTSLFDALAKGDILQVLLVAILTGAALCVTRAEAVTLAIGQAQRVVFTILGFIMRLAPIGAFGAIAAAVGANGASALAHLAALVGLFYGGVLLFIIVVLGGITALAGLSLWSILLLVRAELLLVFSTASTEFVIPGLLAKLEQAGVKSDIAQFVLPAGYSFNLDGTALYMAMAVGFIAQATDTPCSINQQLALLAVMMLTSKGSIGMAGGSLIKLAATMQNSHTLPMAGLGLLFGVERPIGSAIATTNVIGNVVAAFVIAKWDGGLDSERLDAALGRCAGQRWSAGAAPAGLGQP